MPKQRPGAASKARKKAAARNPKRTVGDKVEEVVRIHQQAVQRVAQHASKSIDSLATGKINLGACIDDYAGLLKDLTADAGDVLKVLWPSGR
jgi:hypothetical protein